MLQRTMSAEAIAMIGPAELEDIRLDLEAEEQAQKAQTAARNNEVGTAARIPTQRDGRKEAEEVIGEPGSGDRNRHLSTRPAVSHRSNC